MGEHPVAKRLKERRLAMGFTQEKLGVLAGIDEDTVRTRLSQYESGRHKPTYSTVKKFAAILKVPTPYFYAEEDDLAEYILRYKPKQ